MPSRILPVCFLFAWAVLNARGLSAEEEPQLRASFQVDEQRFTQEGRVVARDQLGGICLQDQEGQLWLIQAGDLIESTPLPRAFEPISKRAMAVALRDRLGDRFQVYETNHYVVAYTTSRDFARWLGSTLERLHKAFVNYWSRRGLELSAPEFPLVVTVHADQAEYRRAAAAEWGGASGVIGYYSLKTNRVSMFDLTGSEELRAQLGGRSSFRDVNRMLSTPSATPLVSTVVHEATHQVAFNTGLMTRFADLPLWYVEGMAIYFEAPDLTSSRRWQGIGKVNYPRLQEFRRHASGWSEDRLRDLLTNDRLIRNTATATRAYAEAWALTYYLMKHRPEQHREYARLMSQKQAFHEGDTDERIVEFEKNFGPIEALNHDFLRATMRID